MNQTYLTPKEVIEQLKQHQKEEEDRRNFLNEGIRPLERTVGKIKRRQRANRESSLNLDIESTQARQLLKKLVPERNKLNRKLRRIRDDISGIVAQQHEIDSHPSLATAHVLALYEGLDILIAMAIEDFLPDEVSPFDSEENGQPPEGDGNSPHGQDKPDGRKTKPRKSDTYGLSPIGRRFLPVFIQNNPMSIGEALELAYKELETLPTGYNKSRGRGINDEVKFVALDGSGKETWNQEFLDDVADAFARLRNVVHDTLPEDRHVGDDLAVLLPKLTDKYPAIERIVTENWGLTLPDPPKKVASKPKKA